LDVIPSFQLQTQPEPVIPAEAGITLNLLERRKGKEIPASAGMTLGSFRWNDVM
jgi:hypothetical protein